MADNNEEELNPLELQSTIGFQGKVHNGLIAHPDRFHIVYAVGQNVIIKNISDGKQYCLSGHSNTISCLAMSNDGSYIASGQASYMGFKAEVIIWDFVGKSLYGKHSVHKVKVEAVAFTCSSRFVVSLGGEDCRNVIIWNVKLRESLCGSPTAVAIGGFSTQVCCTNQNDRIFVTAGKNNLRLWRIDEDHRKVLPTSVPMEKVKREIICLEIDHNDEFLYCGTQTGDVLKVILNIAGQSASSDERKPKLIQCIGKAPIEGRPGDTVLFPLGITAMICLKTGGFLIGTGEGVISRADEKDLLIKRKYELKIPQMKVALKKPVPEKPQKYLVVSRQCQVMGSITAMTLRGHGHQIYVATKTCEIYRVSVPEFLCDLLFTCHGSKINDIAFPHRCSELFATCSQESVRIWNLAASQELLRITVPNMVCYAICFSQNGFSLVSGWNDGKIRAHNPETGRIIYSIGDAHPRGVSALAMTSDSRKVISGGNDGEVRIWDVNPTTQLLHGLMKEHKGAITSIRIKSNDLEAVTSGADGSCIIWDLKKFLRIQVVFANTLFQSVCYGPEECQILTCGTDRMIGYWEVFDGSQIRELEGSLSGAITALDISSDCVTFATGGCDKLLKVWKYQEGVVTHTGVGHSDEITAIRISPDIKTIVSGGKDGSVFIWKFSPNSP